jgi:hypothetical protein
MARWSVRSGQRGPQEEDDAGPSSAAGRPEQSADVRAVRPREVDLLPLGLPGHETQRADRQECQDFGQEQDRSGQEPW